MWGADERTTKKDFVVKKSDKENNTKADKVFEVKATVVSAVIVGAIGIIASCVTDYLTSNSKNAKRCDELEAEIRQKNSLLSEKDGRIADQHERIADQRTEISDLKQAVQSKDNQIAIKQHDINFYQMKVFEQTGRIITHNDEEMLTTAKGTMKERLGIDDKRPLLDQIKETWNKPLAVESLPGVFLPAPQGIIDSYLKMVNHYATNDYSNSVAIARRMYGQIATMIEPFKGVQIDGRFGIVACEVYRIMAEDAFHSGQYRKAAYLMGQSAGLVGKTPPAFLLALESAMICRAGWSQGFFTQHIADAIKVDNVNNDQKYFAEILNELAKLGYLQRFFPNKDGTDIGELIDWKKLCGRKLELRKLENRNGDIWSTRWRGFGEYEEFNLSQEFRQNVKVSPLK